MINTATKQVYVEDETHQRIYGIAEVLRKNTSLRHPAYIVVRMAIGLLEDQLNIAWPPPAKASEDSNAER